MEFIIIAAIIIGVIAALASSSNQAETQKKLKLQYEEALNEGDRSKALQAGRLYYASLRKDGNLTVYDEQALTNDLASLTAVKTIEVSSIADQIEKLGKLKSDGLLSEEEYESAKKRLIER